MKNYITTDTADYTVFVWSTCNYKLGIIGAAGYVIVDDDDVCLEYRKVYLHKTEITCALIVTMLALKKIPEGCSVRIVCDQNTIIQTLSPKNIKNESNHDIKERIEHEFKRLGKCTLSRPAKSDEWVHLHKLKARLVKMKARKQKSVMASNTTPQQPAI